MIPLRHALGETELEIVLAPGAREPLSMLPSSEELTPAQSNVLAATVDTFAERIEEAASSSMTDEALASVWEKEQDDADSVYRALLGNAAYNQKNSEAAAKALGYPSAPPQAGE